MQRHYCFHFGVSVERLLLLSIVLSLWVLMSTSARAVKLSSNGFVLDQVNYGSVKYETISQQTFTVNGFKDDASDMFDKIMDFFSPHDNKPSTSRSTSRSRSGSLRNIEHFTIHKIVGDGRCMFRALVKGMATNDGVELGSREEKSQADELKMEIKRFICDSDNEHEEFEDAIVAITIEEPLEKYCERITKSNFWGGEAELLILSKLLSLPVIVYVPVYENILKVYASEGFIRIANYRPEFKNGTTRAEPKMDVKLLFNGVGANHYDLLL